MPRKCQGFREKSDKTTVNHRIGCKFLVKTDICIHNYLWNVNLRCFWGRKSPNFLGILEFCEVFLEILDSGFNAVMILLF